MPHADLTPALRDRWSPRVFDDTHEISPEELHLLLEAARWAPSAGNCQRWAFFVGVRGDVAHKQVVAHLARGNAGWVPRASAVLVAAYQSADEPGAEKPAYLDWAEYDLGQAAAHLTVQAAAMGLHVHQFAGFDHAAVTEAFGVPAHWTVATGIAVGRLGDPATTEVHEKQPTDRKPLADFVFAERWGAGFEA